ncbi:hypothetical protein BELL_0359g00040 [Botrytis elliptica]|uniref:Uncharacterized protein n=1 Tax=Botrytis elliptica TaxID=278938 RepID=A0A4Z1JIQ9_9HELO|nr:hypothetical protein BELL_0359g00040 [Botrytis elliptica]
MYPGDSFGELEVQAVVQWKKEQKQWWNMDSITDERSIERKRRMNGEMKGDEHLVRGMHRASLDATPQFTTTVMLSLDTYSSAIYWNGSKLKLPSRVLMIDERVVKEAENLERRM